MNKEVPQSNDLVDAFKERAAQRRGRPSMEALAVGQPLAARTGPFGKSKKKAREGGNIAMTTCSPGTMLLKMKL